MSELVPPPPPVGFVYDATALAVAKVEHLMGRKRMRMAEVVESRTQFNFRTGMRETARIPRPDPLTLEIEVDGDWIYIPVGSRIDHTPGERVRLTVDLGDPEHTLAWEADGLPMQPPPDLITDGGWQE